MIRATGERGGVVGVNLYPGFLDADYSARVEEFESAAMAAVDNGTQTRRQAEQAISAFISGIPRPSLSLVVEHIRRIIRVGGEDCAGLGGDLDGIESTPAGFEGVADYPRIARLLEEAGLAPEQIERVCSRNFERVFREVLG
jgi:membrane dipeptidase